LDEEESDGDPVTSWTTISIDCFELVDDAGDWCLCSVELSMRIHAIIGATESRLGFCLISVSAKWSPWADQGSSPSIEVSLTKLAPAGRCEMKGIEIRGSEWLKGTDDENGLVSC